MSEIEQGIRDLIDEVNRLRAESTWQPIETAPKDGSSILLFCVRDDKSSFQITGYWNVGSEVFGIHPEWFCTSHEPIYPPTHWRPLPTPPEQETGG